MSSFFTYLILAALGLPCRVQAFSNCEWGFALSCGVWASHRGGVSGCRMWAPGTRTSNCGTRALGSCGMRALGTWLSACAAWSLVALGHCRSSQTRIQPMSCTGRRTPNRWALGKSCTCVLDVFVGRGELRVLLLWHLDSDV